MIERFPFSENLETEKGTRFHYSQVLEFIWPLLTDERRKRIEQVVVQRSYDYVSVLEDIYDRGNASAVLRTQEALGFGAAHMIQSKEKFKESQRTTAGADKWVELNKWKSTKECVQHLKSKGYQIVATALSPKSVPIHQVDFSKPTAFVLGNEKDGISEEMQQSADVLTILPMTGFVQSYNISVAAALGFYHIYSQQTQGTKSFGTLTEQQKEIVKAAYALRTLDSAHEVLIASNGVR